MKKNNLITKEQVIQILEFYKENAGSEVCEAMNLAIAAIQDLKNYDLKQLFENANPIVDNILVTKAKKNMKSDLPGIKQAEARLSYTNAFPTMQKYFLKWVQWINKNQKVLKGKKK